MPLQVEDVKQVYQSIRSDVDTSFSVIYNHALRVAEAVGTRVVIPGRPFPGRPGLPAFFHSRIPGNSNGQFP